MHEAAFAWVEQWRGPDAWAVLELGGRNVNGGVRELFDEASRYVAVDIVDGPGVDVVADASTVELEPGVWDVVVCCEVLEHVDDAVAERIVHNAHRHLRPGGRLVLTCAGPGRLPHSAIDGGPLRPHERYRNVDRVLMQRWLAPFGATLIDEIDGDLRVVAWR